MNSITQEMQFRQSLMKYSEKYGVKRASRKYNKCRSYMVTSKNPQKYRSIEAFSIIGQMLTCK